MLPHLGKVYQWLRESEVARVGFKKLVAASSFVVRQAQAGATFVGSGLVQALRSSTVVAALVDIWIAWCIAVLNGVLEGVTESFCVLAAGQGGMEEAQAVKNSGFFRL